MSDSASIQGVRFKETVGERYCFCQEATLAEFVVYLDPPSWPWADHLAWASEEFSHQCRAGGGLGWAILTPKEKRSLAITKSFCCDRLTWNSPTHNRTFLTSLCESFLVFESEANTGKVTLVPPVSPALAPGAKQWPFQIFISNQCQLFVFPLLGGRPSRGQDAEGSFVFITSCFLW